MIYGYYREKLHVNHLWELRVDYLNAADKKSEAGARVNSNLF